MRLFLARLFLACALLIWLPLAGAQANEADRQAIQSVIRAQLEAFQRDDGNTAFSFAAPIIQQKFGDSGRFLTMVKRGYDPVYRPTATEFREIELEDGWGHQKVLFVDREGVAWMAHYSMERQADGRWRIAGVRLERLPDLSA